MLVPLLLIQLLSGYPSALPAGLPAWTQARLSNTFDFATYIKPGFLSADFNGDGKWDVAILVARRATGSGGILVLHQGLTKYHVLGAGANRPGADMLSGDLSWATYWCLYTGRTTEEIVCPIR